MAEIEAPSLEEAVQVLLETEIGSLSDAQKNLLSQALFPETHTADVVVLGTKRELRPLTIKWSRKLHVLMQPFNQKATQAAESESVFSVDGDLLEALGKVATLLAEHYGWEDVKTAVDEEDIHIEDLQALAVRQEKLQGDNDFLLAPLRVAIKIMQAREVMTIKTHHPELERKTPSSSSTPA